jgi:hypothetical protein
MYNSNSLPSQFAIYCPVSNRGVICPACKSRSFIAGVTVHEEISDEDNPETGEETVDVTLAAEEFHCPSCSLHLNSRDEIEAAELDVEHIETVTRQREYEPDYGND